MSLAILGRLCLVALVISWMACRLAAGEPEHVPGERFRDCPDCPEMVVVPAGVFDMGTSLDEEDHDPAESPCHRVSIGKPFAIVRYETTVQEWRACLDDDGCLGVAGDPREGGDRLPIMGIAWVLIPSYLEWLNAKSGHSYRLPSEAECEYAARAGSLTRHAFGEELTTGDARVGGKADGPVEVGSYQPNAWGLYDMHGNLAKWIQDCWHLSYAAPTDGSAWVPECIVRGGSWKSDAGAARSAARDYEIEATASRRIGFRVVRSLTE